MPPAHCVAFTKACRLPDLRLLICSIGVGVGLNLAIVLSALTVSEVSVMSLQTDLIYACTSESSVALSGIYVLRSVSINIVECLD